MLRIDIISVKPDLIKSPFEGSIVKRAIDKKLFRNILSRLKRLFKLQKKTSR